MNAKNLVDMVMGHETTAAQMLGAAEALELMLEALTGKAEAPIAITAGEIDGLAFVVHATRNLAVKIVEEAESIAKEALAISRIQEVPKASERVN